MAGLYTLVIKGRDGIKRSEVVNYLSLAYTRKVNAAGLLLFELPPDHPAIPLLELDGQIEVWRRDREMGVTSHRDAGYLYRSLSYAFPNDQDERFTATCPGELHFLSRRIVAYPAGAAGLSTLEGPAETVMRTIVAQNFTSSATVANGRDREGLLPGITVEADQGRGLTVAWSGTRKVVLGELQALAQPTVGGGDFDLVKTGATTWTFRFYPGQLGTDRTSGSNAVVFSRDFDNMGQPHLTFDQIDERTAAIVGGQGQETARAILTGQVGQNYSAVNDIEVFVDARNADPDPSHLQAIGRKALDEAQARQRLTFTPLQTPQTFYGRHYFLGDLVRASYRGLTVTLKVVAATITAQPDGDEQITIELATVT